MELPLELLSEGSLVEEHALVLRLLSLHESWALHILSLTARTLSILG